MQKLLTIVVPVYKVEQYINKCLDSCIVYKADGSLDEEKMNQLEVIIVNDGTPDNSAELSRVYTKRYPQTFRQIDKENGGHGSAWNVGLKEATGKYLRFLDSDDWLTNLDKLMEKLQDCEADLVFTHKVNYFAEKNEFVKFSFEDDYDIIKPIEELPIDRFKQEAWYGEFQKATYRTILLQKRYPLFKEKVRYDDAILYALPIILSKNYICFDFIVYNYYIGRIDQSMNMETQAKYADQRVLAYTYLCDTIDEQHLLKQINEICEYVKAGMFVDIIPSIFHNAYLPFVRLCKSIDKYRPQEIYIQHTKISKRFIRFPRPIVYMLEKMRNSTIYQFLRK